MTKKCEICGETFTPTRPWQIYCKKEKCQKKVNSRRVLKCRKKHNPLKIKKKIKAEKKCPRCHGEGYAIDFQSTTLEKVICNCITSKIKVIEDLDMEYINSLPKEGK